MNLRGALGGLGKGIADMGKTGFESEIMQMRQENLARFQAQLNEEAAVNQHGRTLERDDRQHGRLLERDESQHGRVLERDDRQHSRGEVGFDSQGRPIARGALPDEGIIYGSQPGRETPDATKYTGTFTDRDGVEWRYNPENPDERIRLGEGLFAEGGARASGGATGSAGGTANHTAVKNATDTGFQLYEDFVKKGKPIPDELLQQWNEQRAAAWPDKDPVTNADVKEPGWFNRFFSLVPGVGLSQSSSGLNFGGEKPIIGDAKEDVERPPLESFATGGADPEGGAAPSDEPRLNRPFYETPPIIGGPSEGPSEGPSAADRVTDPRFSGGENRVGRSTADTARAAGEGAMDVAGRLRQAQAGILQANRERTYNEDSGTAQAAEPREDQLAQQVRVFLANNQQLGNRERTLVSTILTKLQRGQELSRQEQDIINQILE